jgi:hypothetical protein
MHKVPVIIVVEQVGAVKVYVAAALETLRKTLGKKETGDG